MEGGHVLMTGATGFIGSHMANRLLEEKLSLVAVAAKDSNYKNVEEMRSKGVILIKGSFYDRECMDRIFDDFPIRKVIHVAALRGGGSGTDEEYYAINVRGTETLLELSQKHNVDKFLFVSSVGVTGTIPYVLPGTTSHKFNGDNAYHRSKVLAEQRVNECITEGLNAYIIRPTITYGPGDTGFPRTLVELVRKRMLFLPAYDVRIHLLDVAALADLVVKMVKIDVPQQRTFIAADESPVLLKDLVNQIYDHYYHRGYPSFLKLPSSAYKALALCAQAAHNEKWLTRFLLISRNWYYDISATIQAFSFVPARTSDSFVKNMCN
ncbi:MAG TPA: NAD(P)-dependent oxidoreductase [Syntrophorhabdaceae bacterium]|nr:NAD(P)-dependent oxidoreductase [Syntrophorhabdaceae bacterium]